LRKGNELRKPEEAVPVKSKLAKYSTITPKQLGNHWK
jgi:hypothetical protein